MHLRLASSCALAVAALVLTLAPAARAEAWQVSVAPLQGFAESVQGSTLVLSDEAKGLGIMLVPLPDLTGEQARGLLQRPMGTRGSGYFVEPVRALPEQTQGSRRLASAILRGQGSGQDIVVIATVVEEGGRTVMVQIVQQVAMLDNQRMGRLLDEVLAGLRFEAGSARGAPFVRRAEDEPASLAPPPVAAVSSDEAEVITDARTGVSFALPAGFVAEENALGYTLTPADKTRQLVVMRHEHKTLKALRKELNRDASPCKGPVSQLGKRVLLRPCAQQQANGQETGGYYLAALSPHGGGLLAIVGSQHGMQDARALVDVFRGSLGFARPDKGAKGETLQSLKRRMEEMQRELQRRAAAAEAERERMFTPRARSLAAQITGQRLLYILVGNGWGTERSYTLCQDGSYSYKSDTGLATTEIIGPNVSAASLRYHSGQWQVIDVDGQLYLELRTDKGQVLRLAAGMVEGRVDLDGTQYYREDGGC